MHRTALDKKVACLHALRSAGDRAAAHEPLRRALNDRNNYIVGRAAAIIGELRLEELIPDLLVAFDRFFEEPVKADPQCLAKNAIAQALKDLGHHAAAAYVRGIVHVQLEPTWGGRADSAAALRGTCALAGIRTRLSGWFLGDQAIFVRRDVFGRLAGFRDFDLFEDLDFSRRMRHEGRVVSLHPSVVSSARRFALYGPCRTTWTDLMTTWRYLRGADPNQLAAEYYRRRENTQRTPHLAVSTTRTTSS